MADSEHSDSAFYRAFEPNMAILRLPAPPESVFVTLAGAAAAIKSMAKVIARLGPRVTVMEMPRTFPSAGGLVRVSAALAEVLGVVGATAASVLGRLELMGYNPNPSCPDGFRWYQPARKIWEDVMTG